MDEQAQKVLRLWLRDATPGDVVAFILSTQTEQLATLKRFACDSLVAARRRRDSLAAEAQEATAAVQAMEESIQ